ncbi:hypothetical protein CCUS01_08092 [Colletotrichum cuscutae]|uniref:Uncharacterized protein n=1 Tax=Colletotrichum cuscutae TaxID=1209917 RepID=A0AAI9UYR8_9PEZI|nr:hypothetical protein CCUS01_08092 [Colletotrichum cuscutae]
MRLFVIVSTVVLNTVEALNELFEKRSAYHSHRQSSRTSETWCPFENSLSNANSESWVLYRLYWVITIAIQATSYSLIVTDSTTNLALIGLSMGERTGSRILRWNSLINYRQVHRNKPRCRK